MRWHVETLNDAVDRELEALDTSFKAKFLHIAELLEVLGPDKVHAPYVKSLGNKLWEIRMKAQPGIARAIYYYGYRSTDCGIACLRQEESENAPFCHRDSLAP